MRQSQNNVTASNPMAPLNLAPFGLALIQVLLQRSRRNESLVSNSLLNVSDRAGILRQNLANHCAVDVGEPAFDAVVVN